MPLFFVLVPGFAQIGNNLSLGELVQFDVKPMPGTSYAWKVMENDNQITGTASDIVTFLSSTSTPIILLKWHKAGIYFLTVTAFNQNGCSNMKAFQVIVDNNHIPVAVDDYISTNWLKSIRLNLLSNDHDMGNDIDSSSLKILSKPLYGRISHESKGVIIYEPVKNQAGKEQFYYSICDLSFQCDTAMVSIDVKDPPLYLPEAISPNGDGKNDQFVIKGLENYPNSSLTILSREGVIIYQCQDYQNDWVGAQNVRRFSSGQAPSGTYYYVLHLGGTRRMIKGFIYVSE